jgi:hypothetical protein
MMRERHGTVEAAAADSSAAGNTVAERSSAGRRWKRRARHDHPTTPTSVPADDAPEIWCGWTLLHYREVDARFLIP